MLRALLDTGGAIGVLALGVPLPPVAHGVVDVHGGTLLLANPVIVEVLARLKKYSPLQKYCIERESCCSEIISISQSEGCTLRHQPIRGKYCIRGNITASRGDNSIISFVRVSTIQSK